MVALYMYLCNEKMHILQYKKVKSQEVKNLQLMLNRLVADVPKNFDIKLSSNISVLIKTMSSNIPYTLLSTEENREENNEFIVEKIVCVIADEFSGICSCSPY